MHLEREGLSLFSRPVLFLDTKRLQSPDWVRYPCPSVGSALGISKLFPALDRPHRRRISRTRFVALQPPLCHCENCHCKNRAPIGTCLDRRQLAGRPGLAPNHTPKPGRSKPTCRRSRALAPPKANVKSAGTPQGLTQPCRFEALYLASSSFCRHSLPCHIPGDLQLLLVFVSPPSRFLGEQMHYRLRLIQTTDSARHHPTHPPTHTTHPSPPVRLVWLLGLETTLVPHPNFNI